MGVVKMSMSKVRSGRVKFGDETVKDFMEDYFYRGVSKAGCMEKYGVSRRTAGRMIDGEGRYGSLLSDVVKAKSEQGVFCSIVEEKEKGKGSKKSGKVSRASGKPGTVGEIKNVYEMYIVKKWSLGKIVEVTGWGETTIKEWLKKPARGFSKNALRAQVEFGIDFPDCSDYWKTEGLEETEKTKSESDCSEKLPTAKCGCERVVDDESGGVSRDGKKKGDTVGESTVKGSDKVVSVRSRHSRYRVVFRPDSVISRRREGVPSLLKLAVYLRDEMSCVYCGRGVEDGIEMSVDHIIPRSKYGPDTGDNLVTACKRCNTTRGNISVSEFCKKNAGILSDSPDVIEREINEQLMLSVNRSSVNMRCAKGLLKSMKNLSGVFSYIKEKLYNESSSSNFCFIIFKQRLLARFGH